MHACMLASTAPLPDEIFLFRSIPDEIFTPQKHLPLFSAVVVDTVKLVLMFAFFFFFYYVCSAMAACS
jgi:hypothetical protein